MSVINIAKDLTFNKNQYEIKTLLMDKICSVFIRVGE